MHFIFGIGLSLVGTVLVARTLASCNKRFSLMEQAVGAGENRLATGAAFTAFGCCLVVFESAQFFPDRGLWLGGLEHTWPLLVTGGVLGLVHSMSPSFRDLWYADESRLFFAMMPDSGPPDGGCVCAIMGIVLTLAGSIAFLAWSIQLVVMLCDALSAAT